MGGKVLFQLFSFPGAVKDKYAVRFDSLLQVIVVDKGLVMAGDVVRLFNQVWCPDRL